MDSLNSLEVPEGATIVATIDVRGDAHAAIVDIPAGASSFGHGVFGERRVFFTMPEYPDIPNTGFTDVLTSNALGILLNTIDELTEADTGTLKLIVDNNADENDENYGPGDLSLREAIQLANGSIGPDTIVASHHADVGVLASGDDIVVAAGHVDVALDTISLAPNY